LGAIVAGVDGAVGNHLPWPAAWERHPHWTIAVFFALAGLMAVLAFVLSMAESSDGFSDAPRVDLSDSPGATTVIGDDNVTATGGAVALAPGASLNAGSVVAIGRVNARHFAVVCERRGSLPLEPALVRLPPEEQIAPSFLLRARFGVVPFVGDDGPLRDVLAWARSTSDNVAALVVSGRGGAGKTRIAVEACRALTEDGWLCGLLAASATPTQIVSLAEEQAHDRLVVVDYAEARSEQTAQLLSCLASLPQTARARVLLLVRSPEVDPRRLCDLTSESSDLVDSVLARTDVVALADHELSKAQRELLFRTAAEAFSGRPFGGAPGLDLEAPKFANALTVVITGYLAVRPDGLTVDQEPVEAFLAHEARYWYKHAKRQQLAVGPAAQELAVAAITLAGTDTLDETLDLLRCVAPVDDSESARHSLAAWLHQLYPGDAHQGPRWVAPVEPDLLGEALIARAIVASPALLERLLQVGDGPVLRRALRTLARGVSDPTSPLVRADAAMRTIDDTVKRQLVYLTDLAVAASSTPAEFAALSRDDALAPTLAQLVNALPLDPSVHEASLRIDLPGVVIDTLALALCQRSVDLLEANSAGNEDELAAYAAALHNLAFRQSRLGRTTEATLTLDKAIELRRRLVGLNPAHLASLASSLNNRSVRLGETGDLEAALTAVEEVVAIRRALVDEDAEVHLPGLARSLNNLSVRLAELGRTDQALAAIEEAVEIRRALVQKDPGSYRSFLPGSLDLYAVRLAETGRQAEALDTIEEAVEIRRGLVEQNPATFAPLLALSLDIYADRLAEAGRQDDALEALAEVVEIRRALAKTQPPVFLRQLANALEHHSRRLTEAGHTKQALIAITEANEIRTDPLTPSEPQERAVNAD
jgi:tetratricopeptide (TPR) repeat protein